jgi:hypothetical protein
VFSPIKFQADMGLLLTFMFFMNMVGALCLIPALVRVIGVPRRVLAASGNVETKPTLGESAAMSSCSSDA